MGKCAIYRFEALSQLYRLEAGRVDDQHYITVRREASSALEDRLIAGQTDAGSFLRNWQEVANDNIVAAGYRITHGGKRSCFPVETASKEIEKALPGYVDDFVYKKIIIIEQDSICAFRHGKKVAAVADFVVPARDEIPLFCHGAARTLCGMVAFLGGLDVLVFTGGHTADSRRHICRYLDWMQLKVNPDANAQSVRMISAPESAVQVLVLPASIRRLAVVRSAASGESPWR